METGFIKERLGKFTCFFSSAPVLLNMKQTSKRNSHLPTGYVKLVQLQSFGPSTFEVRPRLKSTSQYIKLSP